MAGAYRGRRPLWRRAGIVASLPLLLALGLGACAPGSGEPRRAILILLDAARPDRFSHAGYDRQTTPAIDRLAARGVWFQRQFGQDTHTIGALPKLIYSRYFAAPLPPESRLVPLSTPLTLFQRADAEQISLPRALRGDGLATAGISAHTWLREGGTFASEFDEFHDLSERLEFSTDYGYPRAEQVVDYAIEWLAPRLDQELFLYLHLMDTHFPHLLEEEARAFLPEELSAAAARAFRPSGVPKDTSRALSGDERAYLDALYDGSLRYTDRQLGRLFEFLESAGELEHTLIAITSDHGEHLLEHPGRFSHGGDWYDGVARTPLILFYPPRLKAARADFFSESVDVMPTLLALLGVSLPQDRTADGDDLTAMLRGEKAAKEHAFAETAVRSADHKLLLDADLARLGPLLRDPATAGDIPARLFDLAADPLETRAIEGSPDRRRELIAAYRSRLGRPLRRYLAARVNQPPAGAFAVGAKNFELAPEARVFELPRRGSRPAQPPAPRPWTLSRHWRDHYLAALTTREPITLSFPLPAGKYRLFASVRGAARIELPDGRLRELAATPFATRQPRWDASMPIDEIELGEIQITGRRFVARLEPITDSSPFLLSRFGFEPVGAATDPDSDRQREQRLRALGYID